MKKVTMFYLEECPYCLKAFGYIDELKAENKAYADIDIEMIEEEQHPEIIANYNYNAVPCFYFGKEKAFEAYFMIPDAELREGVKKVLDEALEESDMKKENELITEANRIHMTDSAGKVVAEVTFPETADGEFTINRTFVDESLRGQGMASKLVQAAVDEIESRGGTVKATCSYAVKWIEKRKQTE